MCVQFTWLKVQIPKSVLLYYEATLGKVCANTLVSKEWLITSMSLLFTPYSKTHRGRTFGCGTVRRKKMLVSARLGQIMLG